MGDIIALFPQKEGVSDLQILQMLQNVEYRTHSLAAISVADRFRRIFQGSNPFCRLRIVERKRSHGEFAILLIKSGVAKNCDEAETFIGNIIGSEITYAEDGRYYVLRKRLGEDSYFLEFGER